jgi:thymidine phosphorylase
VRLTEELVTAMLVTAAVEPDAGAALARVRTAWDSGEAFARAERWIAAQGGRIDPRREDLGLEIAPVQYEVASPATGYLGAIDTRAVGLALAEVAAARRRADDTLDLATGLEFLPALGDRLRAGDPVARVHARARDQAERLGARVAAALDIVADAPAPSPLVIDKVVDGDD